MREKRIKQLKSFGFTEFIGGQYKLNNFIISSKTISNFSDEQWANLIAPFSDKT